MPRPATMPRRPRTPRRRRSNGLHQSRRARRKPDPRPGAPSHAVGHGRLQPPPRREHAAQGRDGPVGRQAELLRHHRLGQPGRELRAVPREGPPGRDRRPPRVARVGDAGRATSARRSRSSPTRAVPRRPWRRRRRQRRRQRQLHPGRGRDPRGATSRPRRPTTTSRSRRPRMAAEDPDRASGPAAGAARRAPQELPLLQGQGRGGGLQERQPASALHLGEGQDPQPPDHRRVPAPPAAGRRRGEAGPRDGAAAVRRRS